MPNEKRLNNNTHGNINISLKLYVIPNQCITTRNTKIVRIKLNNSLNISDNGKNKTGIFNDLINPAELIILPTDWLVTFEKKNQNIRDDMLEQEGLTPSMTRQYSHEFAEEIARQAELYKNMRMPKSEEAVEETEDGETGAWFTRCILLY